MKVSVTCDNCGKSFIKESWELHEHNFCNRDCFYAFASERMTKMNRDLNPTRMTESTREKLRQVHLNTGEGRTYTKTFGRHTHRIVAEQLLGRPLRPGEVIHHVDGDRRNNDPSNIMVLPSQSEHARVHMRLKKFFDRTGGD